VALAKVFELHLHFFGAAFSENSPLEAEQTKTIVIFIVVLQPHILNGVLSVGLFLLLDLFLQYLLEYLRGLHAALLPHILELPLLSLLLQLTLLLFPLHPEIYKDVLLLQTFTTVGDLLYHLASEVSRVHVIE